MNVLKRLDKNNFSFWLIKDELICILLVMLIFFFDRISKNKIINHQLDNDRVYINDFINLDLVWNTGIGFGLLSSNSSLIYNSITALIGIILIIIVFMIIKSNLFEKTALPGAPFWRIQKLLSKTWLFGPQTQCPPTAPMVFPKDAT